MMLKFYRQKILKNSALVSKIHYDLIENTVKLRRDAKKPLINVSALLYSSFFSAAV